MSVRLVVSLIAWILMILGLEEVGRGVRILRLTIPGLEEAGRGERILRLTIPGLEEVGRGVRILDTIDNTWTGRGG
jgi:hypothetical protein